MGGIYWGTVVIMMEYMDLAKAKITPSLGTGSTVIVRDLNVHLLKNHRLEIPLFHFSDCPHFDFRSGAQVLDQDPYVYG
jgi:hypothetical protein